LDLQVSQHGDHSLDGDDDRLTPTMSAGTDACPISQNTWSTQSFARIGSLGEPDMPGTPTNCEAQNAKAKSSRARLVARIARLVRQEGLDYDAWRYVAKRVRKVCELRPEKRGRRLPRVLTTEEFSRFYVVVDRAEDVQHALMLRLLFYTGVRVSELCGMLVADVDLEACKIRVNLGKGSKDRYVLFGKSFATALRTHIAARPNNRWLFQTQRHGRFSTRRVQQIVSKYALEARVKATPHTFRHQAITWLTRHSGLADAELQLITGHAKRETLAIYQHVALDGDLEKKYQATMKKVEL
jgi:integrase/recombinase XerD